LINPEFPALVVYIRSHILIPKLKE